VGRPRLRVGAFGISIGLLKEGASGPLPQIASVCRTDVRKLHGLACVCRCDRRASCYDGNLRRCAEPLRATYIGLLARLDVTLLYPVPGNAISNEPDVPLSRSRSGKGPGSLQPKRASRDNRLAPSDAPPAAQGRAALPGRRRNEGPAKIGPQEFASVRACGYHGARNPPRRGEARTRPPPYRHRRQTAPSPPSYFHLARQPLGLKDRSDSRSAGDLSDLPKPGNANRPAAGD
jgi:hypothetical protein